MSNVGGAAVALAFWVVTLVSDIANIQITNSWVDNDKLCFNGEIKIQLGENGHEGWEIQIKSSKNFSSLTSSHADVSRNGSNDWYWYLLVNKAWNSQLVAEETMKLPFLACTSNADELPNIEVEFRRNQEICPKQTLHLESPVKYINVPSVLTKQWSTGFQAYLNITLKAMVQDGWKIYLAFSRSIYINVENAISVPSHGHIFTLENMSWNKKFMSGRSYLINYVGNKIKATDPIPCVYALFTWKEQNLDSSITTSSKTPPTSQLSSQHSSNIILGTIELTNVNYPSSSTSISITTPLIMSQSRSLSPAPPTVETPIPTSPGVTSSFSPTAIEEHLSSSTHDLSIATPSIISLSLSPTPLTVETPIPSYNSPDLSFLAQSTIVPNSPSCASFNYSEVLHKSILFYEAQRSGKLPSNNRVSWRGDSALGDKGDENEDLTGGWYDAGDHVKFGFPMAFSTTLLSWGLIEFSESYSSAGELQNMFDSIKWPLDYFIKAHVRSDEFYGQVGDGNLDHAYWGRPEDMTMSRPAYKIDRNRPGSDLAAETAAAMAAGSIVFRQSNSNYSDLLLNHSKTLYEFADQYRGKYSDNIQNAASFYSSSGYNDELAWAATWLYKATGEESYLQKAEQYFTQYGIGNPAWAFSWDEKVAGVQMLLYELTRKTIYQTAIENSLNAWLPGGSVSYTPKGLAWRIKWGSNRYAANTAFLALLASAKGLRRNVYREFGEKQIHYMLGDSGRSYVVGFGNNPPKRPHHRSSSCPDKPASCGSNEQNSDAPNPQILYGALVGGPDQNDIYQDNRNDYIKNEVACDYNAGFQSAVAALKAVVDSSCSMIINPTVVKHLLLSTDIYITTPPIISLSLSAHPTIETPITSSPRVTSFFSIFPTAIDEHLSSSTGGLFLTTPSIMRFSLSPAAPTVETPIPSLPDVTSSLSIFPTAIDEHLSSSTGGLFLTTPSIMIVETPIPSLPDVISSFSIFSTEIDEHLSSSTHGLSLVTPPIISLYLPSAAPTVETLFPSSPDVSSFFSITPEVEIYLSSLTQGLSITTPPITSLSLSPAPLTVERPIPSSLDVTFSFSVTPTTVEKYLSLSTGSSITTLWSSKIMPEISTKTSSYHYISTVSASATQSPLGPHECGDVSVPPNFNYLELPVVVLQNWPQGFTGQINITAPAHVRNGWEIILLLKNSISLLQVYVVTTTPSSGAKFTLTNKDYNKELAEGSVTLVDFTATKANDNDDVPCVRAVLFWAKEEDCPSISQVEGYNSIDATLTIESQWNDGVGGKITVVVPAGVQNGWKVKVIFSVPITLIVYVATSSPETGTMFTLTNMDYNKVLTAGTSFVIAFTGTKQETGSTVLCASAIFLW